LSGMAMGMGVGWMGGWFCLIEVLGKKRLT